MEQQQHTEVLAALPVRAYISSMELLGVKGEVCTPEPMSEDAEALLSATDVAEVLAYQRGLRLTVEEQLDEALKQNRRLGAQVDLLTGERNGWHESAMMFARGQEFYQGIVREIGAQFGPEAYLCDDGSESSDVLALKVPELVEELFTDYFDLYEKQNDSLPRRVLRGVRNLFSVH